MKGVSAEMFILEPIGLSIIREGAVELYLYLDVFQEE